MHLLKSVILEEISTLLMEVDKRQTLAKFGFNEKLQNEFHEMDNKVSPWFASIITFQFAKENNIQGKNLAEIVAKIDQDDLLLFLRQKKPVLNYIKDWIKSPRRPQNINLQAYRDLDAAYKASDEWHREIQQAATGKIEGETGEIIKKYSDYYWIDLQCNSSDAEANAMGHCGTDSRATTLYSLRDIHTKEPHVTVAVNEPNGLVTQVKGKGNRRPVDKYMNFVHDLFKEYFENGKLRGFQWSYAADLDIEDIKKIFPDKFDFMGIIMSSPSYSNNFEFSSADYKAYLKHFINYDNINIKNFGLIKGRVNKILPRSSKHQDALTNIHNELVFENLKADKENVLAGMIILELPRQFMLKDIVAKFGLTVEDFKQVIQTASSDYIIGLMNAISSGYIYPIANGRNMTAEEMYVALVKMVEFEDREDYRERIVNMIGDRINVLKGTPFAAKVATELPSLVKQFPSIAQAVGNGNVSEAGDSLFKDFLRRNSSSSKPPRTGSKEKGFSIEPVKSNIPPEFDKYSRYANKVTGVNLENKRKRLIHDLDQKQHEFFSLLKNGLQGFDVKPKERNIYLENRTYDYTITFKKYPLIVEHQLTIVPHDGYFNVRYDNKVSVDTTTYDPDMINKLIKYKHPTVQIKKEGNHLVYKLPFQASSSLTNQAQFTDVNKLNEIGKSFIQKIQVFNNEILKAFKKAY